MADHLLTALSPTNRVLKRAQYEAFEFSLIDGDILVRNGSYDDPENHEYRVRIEDGVPTECECPADTYSPGACKHRVAVAIRRPILEAACEMQFVADGGAPPLVEIDDDDDDEADGDDCDCADLPGDFPCWECVRQGWRGFPNST